jgi:hypothetical protein
VVTEDIGVSAPIAFTLAPARFTAWKAARRKVVAHGDHELGLRGANLKAGRAVATYPALMGVIRNMVSRHGCSPIGISDSIRAPDPGPPAPDAAKTPRYTQCNAPEEIRRAHRRPARPQVFA